MSTETVLIAGATGNIGLAAALAVLKTKRQVLAIVRNQDSASKLISYLGTSEGVTTVEADVTKLDGIQSVVDKVRAGKLPSFQHVIATVGGVYTTTKMHELSVEEFRMNMDVAFESNFYVYRATIPYLLEQGHPGASWTLQTGYVGEIGVAAAPAMSQSALFGLATAGIRELNETNVRFNELRLGFFVARDDVAETQGATKASEYAQAIEKVLDNEDMRGGLIRMHSPDDLVNLKFQKNAGALGDSGPVKIYGNKV